MKWHQTARRGVVRGGGNPSFASLLSPSAETTDFPRFRVPLTTKHPLAIWVASLPRHSPSGSPAMAPPLAQP